MPCAVGLSVCRQPQNIFVTFESDGQPCAKIADFGHSRIFSRQRKLHIFHQQASGQFVCGYKLLFRFVVGCWGKRHIYSTTSRILQLQWLCAPQTEPIYSLGCSPNPLSRILACSHTCIHSPNLPFNGINPCNPCNYMSICQRLTFKPLSDATNYAIECQLNMLTHGVTKTIRNAPRTCHSCLTIHLSCLIVWQFLGDVTALVVTLAMLLRLINCGFIIINWSVQTR